MSIDQLLLNRGVLIEEVRLASLDISDRTFALGGDDLELLEESLARDGQLDPVIARRQGERWQIVDGFRRLAAAQHLGWDRVKVRLFDELSDEDAARMTTRNAVSALPDPDAFEALATRLPEAAAEVVRESAHRFERRSDVSVEAHEDSPVEAPPAHVTVAEAAPEVGEENTSEDEEVTLEDLAQRLVTQLSGISQDLALVQENWADLGEEQRAQLRDLVRYTAELLPYLEE